MFAALNAGIMGRAQAHGFISIHAYNLREYGLGNHRQVDDTPYGGGCGMVMRPEPLAAAIDEVIAQHPTLLRILMSPQGEMMDQALVQGLARNESGLLLIAGRYEGIDARVLSLVDREVSIGDYVLSGGELPAMVVIEAVARLLPGVLGNSQSLAEESFGLTGMLEYPHFTRPEEFREMRVPEVLLSGDHRRIREWRETEARKRTAQRRPGLLPTSNKF
jgi:tRNA (guanine37-N1)-methyltransferase